MIEIAQAILAAQKEMGNAKKGAQNPFFKSKYADLNSIREACLPALHKNGISVLQPTVTIDGVHYVKTVLLHTTGQMFDSLTQIVFAKQNDAQAQGSGITYARRYGLQSLLCIGADDDDGNGAVKPEKTQKIPIDLFEQLHALFKIKGDKLSEDDFGGIERVIQNKEENLYAKCINHLKTL